VTKKNPPGVGRRAHGLISGVILANELFRSTTLLAPESQEVGLAISHLVGGEQHGEVAAGAKRVLASVQRVQ
jgi:sensor domain CHASE-containing protein